MTDTIINNCNISYKGEDKVKRVWVDGWFAIYIILVSLLFNI